MGKTGVALGGGRVQKGDPIDYGVGIICHAKYGNQLAARDLLFTIHANAPDKLAAAKERLLAAVTWSDVPCVGPPHILNIIE